MNVVAWLEQIQKLDELIAAKRAERTRLRELAWNTVGSLDGMPHAPGIADKVGSLAAKIADLDGDISRYDEERREIIQALECLPSMEYGVIHREYVRGMKQEEIARDMGYSTVSVWRIKKRALKILEEKREKERG